MNDNAKELAVVEIGALAVISKAEMDQQIATAHQYKRSIRRFLDESRDLVTLSEEVAEECIYSLPRGGKVIEGPSARFAEVIFSSWGNCRAGARIIDEGAEFVTAQGFFHDLEKNCAMTYEVKRRITDKYGKRFNADMIAVTANAACSIAMRNAILRGIPKAIWSTLYNEARRVVAGDEKTLTARRDAAMSALQKMGATKDQVLGLLSVSGVEDIGQDELVTLRGVVSAVRDGATTIDKAFAKPAVSKAAMTLTALAAERLSASVASADAASGRAALLAEVASLDAPTKTNEGTL